VVIKKRDRNNSFLRYISEKDSFEADTGRSLFDSDHFTPAGKK
jgi:hypothetical protein